MRLCPDLLLPLLLGPTLLFTVLTTTEAQQAGKVPRIGILVDGHPAPTPEEGARSPLIQGLRDLGWISRQTVTFDVVYSEGKTERLAELAADLVRRQVDVIWANGPAGTVAAARATKAIPIVFCCVSYPVELGLVASLGRPGGNVTGVGYSTGPEAYGKQLEFLKEIAPGTVRVAAIWGAASAYDVSGQAQLTGRPVFQQAARQLGIEWQGFPVRQREDFESVFVSILGFRAQALVGVGDPLTIVERSRIVEFANQNRLATSFGMRAFTMAGGLVSYGPNDADTVRRSAHYLDKILRGAKPAELPVEQPTKYELIINLKTAKALGLTIPPSLLLRADQVIE